MTEYALRPDTGFSMIILAGGKSSRMGKDKSDLPIHGESFLLHQIKKGQELGIEDILVSGYRGMNCPVPVIEDRYPERGPLGGLESCLRRIRHPQALVLSVDVPLVPTEELGRLIAFARENDAKAVALQHGSHQEPLIGVYRASAADDMLEEITVRKGSVFACLRRIGCSWYQSGRSDECFVNINQPELYRKYIETT